MTPSTLWLLTRSMLRHGDGGTAVLPRLPRAVKTISLDLEQLSFRLLPAAHASMCAISAMHRLEFAAVRSRNAQIRKSFNNSQIIIRFASTSRRSEQTVAYSWYRIVSALKMQVWSFYVHLFIAYFNTIIANQFLLTLLLPVPVISHQIDKLHKLHKNGDSRRTVAVFGDCGVKLSPFRRLCDYSRRNRRL